MTADQIAAAARADVLGRLAAYAATRARLTADIHEAADLGVSTSEIARTAGIARQTVYNILERRRLTAA